MIERVAEIAKERNIPYHSAYYFYTQEKAGKGIYHCKRGKLTKCDLVMKGVTDVAKDGSYVKIKGKKVGFVMRGRYVYCKKIFIAVHRLVYVWNVWEQEEGCVIDHIDNNPLNNDVSNLQCITLGENVTKNKPKYRNNQYTKGLTQEQLKELAEIKEKKNKMARDLQDLKREAKKEKEARKAALEQYKELRDRKLRYLQYYLAVARDDKNKNKTKYSIMCWKEAIKDLKDFEEVFPKPYVLVKNNLQSFEILEKVRLFLD